jgi:hypothetical protein
MKNNNICEKSESCPIYEGVLKSNYILTSSYKSVYCNNGIEGKNNCKRFQVSKILGSCPSNLLPNHVLSVDEIISKIKSENKVNLISH